MSGYRVDLCADVGEGFGAYRIGDDPGLLSIVTSANVACGFHAGDPRVMANTVERCIANGVSVGAHPGFADRLGFGRRRLDMPAADVAADCLYQLGALSAFAQAAGTSLRHVTPHGSLGNLAVSHAEYADGVIEAVAAFDSRLRIYTFAGELQRRAEQAGLPVGILFAADRGYDRDGVLVDRGSPGALIEDRDEIARRAVEMATQGTVTAVGGKRVELDVDSILLHGDNADAVSTARVVRSALEAAGVEVAAPR